MTKLGENDPMFAVDRLIKESMTHLAVGALAAEGAYSHDELQAMSDGVTAEFDLTRQGGGKRPSPSTMPAHPPVSKNTSPWQIRTLPDHLGWGLYSPGDTTKPPEAREPHWYGINGHRAVSPYSAQRFSTAGAAGSYRQRLVRNTPNHNLHVQMAREFDEMK